jgi:peptidoglycan/xylan/chitin deacetylase (PgdA/CDA1 family)
VASGVFTQTNPVAAAAKPESPEIAGSGLASFQGTPVKLDGSAAIGGVKNKEGDSVYLAAAMGTTEEIRWEFAEPLAPGAWRLTIDFNGKVGGAKCQNIGFIADRTPVIDCNVNTDEPQSFVLLNAAPAKGLFYRKTYQVNQDTVGIRSILIDKIETPLPSDRWCLDCQVVDGTVSLPWAIAPGSMKTTATAPVALTWSSAGGKFEPPSATQTFAYCKNPVERLAVAGKVDAIIIERIPPTPVPDMPVTNKELITVVDSAKPETRTLTLVGALDGTLTMAIFPSGRKHAIFTTWDDGSIMDLAVAEMLKKHGFRGTFLMNRSSEVNKRLSELEALGMEVGSHSWSHPSYYVSGYDRSYAESANMRKFLEGTLGHPVISFAYPYGYQPAYDESGDYVTRSVEASGYWFARTTANGPNTIDGIKQPLTLAPDFHFNAGATTISARFDELTKKEGVVFEVWGHSVELAGNGAATLEAVLAAIGGKPDVWYATGGDVFVWRWMRMNTRIADGVKDATGMTFTVTRPWLHPYLRTIPFAVKVPPDVTEVIWKGKKSPVIGGNVDLEW